MGTEKIQIIATAQDRASGPINTLRGNISKLGTKTTGPIGGMLSGISGFSVASLGAGVGFAALVGGLKSVGEFLGNATNAAIADEKSVRSLGQALRENVPSWDGTTAAIDAVTEAGIRLGFADDASRASIQKLVIATGDITKSLYLYSIAQDVARGRDIDLAQATDIVAKANIGNSRALKMMGIDLGRAATGTELLAELQRRFSGQAEDYAETTAGSIDATAQKIGELNEKIGGGTMPAMTGMVDYVSDTLIPGFENLTNAAGDVTDSITGMFGAPSGGKLMMTLNSAASDIREQTSNGGAAMDSYMDFLNDRFVAGGGEIREAARSFASDLDRDLADSLESNTGVIDEAMDKVTWAIEHPMELTRQLANLQGAMTTLEYKRGLEGNTAGINTIIDQQMDVIRAQWFLLTGQAYGQGQNVTQNYQRGLSSINPRVPRPSFTKNDGHTYSGMAAGGFIPPGETRLTGERGVELVTAGRRGATVTPNHQLGGQGPIHVVSVQELARLLDQNQGRQLALAPSSNYSR